MVTMIRARGLSLQRFLGHASGKVAPGQAGHGSSGPFGRFPPPMEDLVQLSLAEGCEKAGTQPVGPQTAVDAGGGQWDVDVMPMVVYRLYIYYYFIAIAIAIAIAIG
jgi:hypothetical protein